MSAPVSGSQIHFLSLQTAIFCVQCELISTNNTHRCVACGSKAVLSLSRLFGGSLRAQPAARVIEDDELNRLVRLICRGITLALYSQSRACAIAKSRHARSTLSRQSA